MKHARIWATATPGRYVGDGHVDAVSLAAGPADVLPKDFIEADFEGVLFPESVEVEPVADVGGLEALKAAEAVAAATDGSVDDDSTSQADTSADSEADSDTGSEAGAGSEQADGDSAEETEPVKPAAAPKKPKSTKK